MQTGPQEVAFQVDGERVRGEHFQAAPRVGRRPAGLVLVHGFNSSLEEYGQAPRWLAAAGFHVLAFDQRGFGKSEGEPGLTRLERALADIDAAAQELGRRMGADAAPLGLVGHSLGGAYALAALARPGQPFAAAAVAHPVDRLWDDVEWWKKPAYHVLGRIGQARMRMGGRAGHVPYRTSARQLFVSREAQIEAGRPDFLQKRANLANYAWSRAMQASQWARGVRVPTLCVVGPADRAVSIRHSLAVYEALPEPKALVEHRGGHSCFRDFEGKAVVAAMADWFGKRLIGGSP